MNLAWASWLQMDLNLRSVRHFLNVPPEIVHKHDRVARSQGVPTSAQTRAGGGLSELLCENTRR